VSQSRRINRLEVPSIDVTFRDDVALNSQTVWREDRIASAGSTYLVLDFGMEERAENLRAGLDDEADVVWRPTGRMLVEIQRINPDTGEGLSLATFKEIAGEEGSVTTWNGWTLQPVSTRRPAADFDPPLISPDTDDEDERCLICGSPDVTYHDADGTPRCQQHIGESFCEGSGQILEAVTTGLVRECYRCTVCHKELPFNGRGLAVDHTPEVPE
jgi:hypothetical protein